MNLNNLNGTSFNRPERSGSVNKQQRTEEARSSSGASGSGRIPFKSDSVHITSGRYSNDLEFARDVYDKLEAASLKELKSIKAAYAEGTYNKTDVYDKVSKKLAHTFALEKLTEQVLNRPEPPVNANLLTPERQQFLIENKEVVDITVEHILESLRDL